MNWIFVSSEKTKKIHTLIKMEICVFVPLC